MSADQAQREPTMEEILASIRRIISEEDKPAEAADVLELAPPAPVVAPKLTPQPPSPPEALVVPPAPKAEPVVAAAPPTPPPLQIFDEPEMPSRPLDDELMIMEEEAEVAPAPAAYVPPVAEPRPDWRQPDPGAIVGAPAATKAADALGKLMGSMVVTTGNTLDDVVRQMLKPMLKEWLDANLPAIVEAEVEREIERIRRLAR